MISLPHPYREDFARQWLHEAQREAAAGTAFRFAVTPNRGTEFLGAAELRALDREHQQAELSFWIAVPLWGCGYATEAGRRLLEFAFSDLRINRVYAHHMRRNPASGRVLGKLGMTREGLLRERVKKWGRFEDVVLMALLYRDWAHANG